MSPHDFLVVATGLLIFCGITGLMLVSRPAHGRHRRGWLSNLVTAVKRYYGFGVPVPPRVSVLPRCASDDWHADPPTVELPVVPSPNWSVIADGKRVRLSEWVDQPQRTAAQDAIRGHYELGSPIFAELAKPLGFDPVRGFDALFADALVAA
ncbi:hypothetical protein ABW16_21375 [Mycolicibacter heraklionensis]|uniref:Type II secretion system protein n=1 Tax=Mycolicibacter heraklionensis TaxID=512402 RepID=A0ABR5FA09_9MYCO|nr:hypothetical protein [Mycolicibacter heraklionensis]KLO25871.1 hypothetical protein ABW16_21375 [Mycolicibacter heraklionensis]